MKPPLPFDHSSILASRPDIPLACTEPESSNVRMDACVTRCPGCRAWAVAKVVSNPSSVVTHADGSAMAAVESIRLLVDPFDPMLVLMERELAKRGAA